MWAPSLRDGTDGAAPSTGWRSGRRIAAEGLGQSLLRAAEERLAGLGGRRLHAIVVEANANAVAFWDATDWEPQAGQLRFAKG